MWVPVVTPRDLCAAFPGPFSMVNLDIEGWSLDIMREFPWLDVDCRFAVIEALRGDDFGVDEVPIVIEYMRQFGFRHMKTTRENVVVVR
jgi:hypothetical protein